MLYIVGTPIGNLNDISLRQAKIMAQSDAILAEDTRSLAVLAVGIKDRFNLNFKSNQQIISYYKEKEMEKLSLVIDYLKQGKTVSLISESGMPLISDPGYLLVKTVIKENLPFEVIPGPSAVTTSLIYSGFNPKQFMFLGYFPRKQSEMFQLINKLKQIRQIFPKIVFVFYESPKRINETLQCINTLIPDAKIVICREMTKKFEEIIRGKPRDLMDRSFKGELTVVLIF